MIESRQATWAAAATLSSLMCFLNSIVFLLGCAAFVSFRHPGRALPGGLAPPRPSKRYDDLAGEYQAWYDACEVRPD